jgi:hypothetical protein
MKKEAPAMTYYNSFIFLIRRKKKNILKRKHLGKIPTKKQDQFAFISPHSKKYQGKKELFCYRARRRKVVPQNMPANLGIKEKIKSLF